MACSEQQQVEANQTTAGGDSVELACHHAIATQVTISTSSFGSLLAPGGKKHACLR
jgi:hypothetical protein